MKAHVILARLNYTHDEVVVELRKVSDIDQRYLPILAEIAADFGFTLMYEFDHDPNMNEVERMIMECTKRPPKGRGIAAMPGMEKLWHLERR